MKIPVIPFLFSLALLLGTAFAYLMQPATFKWLFCIATINFAYSSYREIWHNGKPATLGRRK